MYVIHSHLNAIKMRSLELQDVFRMLARVESEKWCTTQIDV
jgi:hypothetical protein